MLVTLLSQAPAGDDCRLWSLSDDVGELPVELWTLLDEDRVLLVARPTLYRTVKRAQASTRT